jgi:thioredoxin-like negative regulator of GroEL
MSTLEVTSKNFDTVVLENSTPTVVLWTTNGNAPASQIESTFTTYFHNPPLPLLVKANIDKDAVLAIRFSIRFIPYLMLFVDGNVVATATDMASFVQATQQWIS